MNPISETAIVTPTPKLTGSGAELPSSSSSSASSKPPSGLAVRYRNRELENAERRLRRLAERFGLRVIKSHTRDSYWPETGTYAVVDEHWEPVFEKTPYKYGHTFQECADFLAHYEKNNPPGASAKTTPSEPTPAVMIDCAASENRSGQTIWGRLKQAWAVIKINA